MRPWTERLPERLTFELAEFERLAPGFAPDEAELAQHRRLVMRGMIEHNGTQVQASIVYPDSFPYMRPEVYAPGLAIDRHFNPFDGNLCLLDRASREWNTTDTGAWLIDTRLPELLSLLTQGGEALLMAEAPQGEPLTSFLTTFTGAALFVAQETLEVPEHINSGTLELGLGMPAPAAGALRAAALSVRAAKQSGGERWRSAPVPERLSARFQAAQIAIPWVRLDGLPRSRDPAAFIEKARKVSPEAVTPRWLPAQGGQIAPLALLVPEEVHQGKIEQTWVLVIRVRPPAGARQPAVAYLLRGERLSIADLHARIPALAGIETRTVSLAGLGTLGAPIAMELARTQLGRLRMLDMDMIEVGNIVRWPFGLNAVGAPKSGFLAQQIQLQYPFTDVVGFSQHVGDAIRTPSQERESDVLSAFLTGSDLLVDATGEMGVSQLLADLAMDQGTPMLCVWGTEGGWGGGVAEIRPDAGGCWFCLQIAIDRGAIPAAPAEGDRRVQPRGCGAPTFTGSSFDMLEIVAQALRCARRTLLEPPRPSTVHVCSMRSRDGKELDAPIWETFALDRQLECPCCGKD
jgi:hypothetical protein